MRQFSLLLILALVVQARAGDAVSALNGKLGFNYGDYDSTDGHSLNGSVALPLSTHFGAQLDGLYANVGSVDFYGAGGHIFWRDSAQGLVGLVASAVDSKAVQTQEAGVEAERYFPWLTTGIYLGYSRLKYDTPVPFIDTDRTEPFASVYLGFYPLPNLLIRPSITRKMGNNQWGVETEYTMHSCNLALTAEIVRGEHDFQLSNIGLRYYFGGKKSLKARHREDDPANLVASALTTIGTSGAEYNQKAKAYVNELVQNYVNNGGTLTNDANTTSGGILPTSGDLVKSGSASLTLNGSNTYNGSVVSGSGSLTVSGSNAYGGSIEFSSSSGTLILNSHNVITSEAVLLGPTPFGIFIEFFDNLPDITFTPVNNSASNSGEL